MFVFFLTTKFINNQSLHMMNRARKNKNYKAKDVVYSRNRKKNTYTVHLEHQWKTNIWNQINTNTKL